MSGNRWIQNTPRFCQSQHAWRIIFSKLWSGGTLVFVFLVCKKRTLPMALDLTCSPLTLNSFGNIAKFNELLKWYVFNLSLCCGLKENPKAPCIWSSVVGLSGHFQVVGPSNYEALGRDYSTKDMFFSGDMLTLSFPRFPIITDWTGHKPKAQGQPSINPNLGIRELKQIFLL